MTILLMILSYLLGSIPTGLWIGQFFYHKNLRKYGSGSTGTTNTFRILGRTAGIFTFLIDFLKGTIASLLPFVFHIAGVSPMVFGLLAVLGHSFPIFANFKGGKAVATSAGVLLGFSISFFLYLSIIFSFFLYLTSMISFSSIITSVTAIFSIVLFPSPNFLLPHSDWFFILTIFGLALIITARHLENIKRIYKREENLVPWGLNITKQKPKKS